jgi:diaminopimelate epimerase
MSIPMKKLRFTKMQGAGNDFVVVDGVRQDVVVTTTLARALADRHFGIGCDQLLLVEPPASAGVDFRYRIFNADGGEVEQCGNGARCFVRFVHDQGLSDRREIRVETRSGVIVPRLEANGEVSVDMGAPVFEPARVPFDASGLVPIGAREVDGYRQAPAVWPIDVDGVRVEATVLSMGNPHAVQFVADVAAAPVAAQGPRIESHLRFPARANAGYAEVVDDVRIRLRVYERGAGETLACGTGACAAVVAGIRRGLLEDKVRVATRGGELTIAWAGADNPVILTGPAVRVFEGEVDVDALLDSLPREAMPDADPPSGRP